MVQRLIGVYSVDSSGADCKSVVFGLGWCNSINANHIEGIWLDEEPVLKTGGPKGFVSSSLTPSAIVYSFSG